MATAVEKMSALDNLFESERNVARGKRGKNEVYRFELDLTYNIAKLSYEISHNKYKVSPYRKFEIYEPKKREIQALRFRDRLVQNCICTQLLRPWLEPRLIYDNAACRIGKGVLFSQKRLSGFMADYYRKHGNQGYLLKIDIRKYFDSIDHQVLKSKLSKFPTKMARDIFFRIIDGYHSQKGEGKGLPMGNQTSQWFALFYLDSLDRKIKEKYRIKYYTRYMDDMVIIHHDRQYLQNMLVELRQYAKEVLKLEFNEKTQISPLSQGVEYLGFRFYMANNGKVVRKLRTSAKQRVKKNIKKLQYLYNTGKVDWDYVQCRLTSYKAYLAYTHTFHLQKSIYDKTIYCRQSDVECDYTFDGIDLTSECLSEEEISYLASQYSLQKQYNAEQRQLAKEQAVQRAQYAFPCANGQSATRMLCNINSNAGFESLWNADIECDNDMQMPIEAQIKDITTIAEEDKLEQVSQNIDFLSIEEGLFD